MRERLVCGMRVLVGDRHVAIERFNTVLVELCIVPGGPALIDPDGLERIGVTMAVEIALTDERALRALPKGIQTLLVPERHQAPTFAERADAELARAERELYPDGRRPLRPGDPEMLAIQERIEKHPDFVGLVEAMREASEKAAVADAAREIVGTATLDPTRVDPDSRFFPHLVPCARCQNPTDALGVPPVCGACREADRAAAVEAEFCADCGLARAATPHAPGAKNFHAYRDQ